MTAYVLNEEKMYADIADGVAIIINADTGIYYGIYDLGTVVFEKLMAGISYETILSALKRLDNAPQDIEQKLQTFVNDLCDKGLLQKSLVIGNYDEISFDNIVTMDDFTLEVKEYNDAQELLMADPIHEVKETTGWTPEKESVGYTKEETLEREKKMINND